MQIHIGDGITLRSGQTVLVLRLVVRFGREKVEVLYDKTQEKAEIDRKEIASRHSQGSKPRAKPLTATPSSWL